jgi:hypothetical protein
MRWDGDAPGAPDLVDHRVGNAGVRAPSVGRAAVIVDDDGRAVPRQLDRVMPTEAAACTGDDRDLSGEVDHGCPLALARDSVNKC